MAESRALWQDAVMPKDRKMTYGDHQAQAARVKKLKKTAPPRAEQNQSAEQSKEPTKR